MPVPVIQIYTHTHTHTNTSACSLPILYSVLDVCDIMDTQSILRDLNVSARHFFGNTVYNVFPTTVCSDPTAQAHYLVFMTRTVSVMMCDGSPDKGDILTDK